MPLRVIASLLLGALLFSSFQALANGDAPPNTAPPVQFEKLIERIRATAATDDWKKPDWKDEFIESALKHLVNATKDITGDPRLRLPLEFSEATSPNAAGKPRLPTGILHITSKNAKVAFASKSVFLVDGSIHISHASDCIVIARGVVDIGHANHCFVVAGHHINLGFDGHGGFALREDGQTPAAGSILLSGASIAIAHAEGSICCAPASVAISHANSVRFIASPNRELSHQRGCQFLDNAVRPLSIPAPRSVPADLFTVKQIVADDDRAKQLVVVQRNGREYVIRPGLKLADENGQPIPSWSNWRCDFISEGFVLFTDGQNDVSARVP